MNKNIKNIVGQKFGLLNVLQITEQRSKAGQVYFKCKCDCEKIVYVRGADLRSGVTKSCGCFRDKRNTEVHTKHGLIKLNEYKIWLQMRNRCNNINHHKYHRYGGRGIKVCKRWDSFELFLYDVGKRPTIQHSLERKDNNGNYEPNNVIWALPTEQANNRNNNKSLTFNGETLSISQWSKRVNISRSTINNRIFRSGWSIEQALTIKPVYSRSLK